jgi:hypothetical protein
VTKGLDSNNPANNSIMTQNKGGGIFLLRLEDIDRKLWNEEESKISPAISVEAKFLISVALAICETHSFHFHQLQTSEQVHHVKLLGSYTTSAQPMH